tara:strand:- start:4865 stop:6250 length:1386 start_codon:yes stop_codon:yes gene_type:complete
MTKTRSITQRLLGSATLWILFPLILGGVLTSSFLKAPILESLDRQVEQELTYLIEFTSFTPAGEIKPYKTYYTDNKFNRQNSGWYWQISRVKDEVIVGRSLSMKGFEISYRESSKTTPPNILFGAGPEDTDLHVKQKFVIGKGTNMEFQFLIATDAKNLVDSVDKVNERLIYAFGIIVFTLLIGILAQVTFSLRPLENLKRSLSEIREGKKHNLDDSYPIEVKPLVEEINAHINHTEKVLLSARAEVGNLAHALKTPISVISNENREPTTQCNKIVQVEIDKIERHISSYLRRERETYINPLIYKASTNVKNVVSALSNAVKKQYIDRKINIHIEVDEALTFKGAQTDLEELLGNLIENAGKFCKANIWINVEEIKSKEIPKPMLRFLIEDDGPGIAPENRETMFSRGNRYDETVPGSGFGLSIVKQIANLYGGSIHLAASPKGGLSAILKLPKGHISETL